jgi:rod shape-determining protein MreC
MEMVAFVMLMNNRYQKAAFINSANAITGGYYSALSNVQSYFTLKKENQQLQKENAKLRTAMLNFPSLTEDLAFFEKDSNINIFPAQIISGQISGKNNYFLINKGSQDGVHKDMGVISSDAGVGITVNVSSKYALVLPLINMNSKISAKIKKNNYKASLIWDGQDYRYALLIDIPNHLKLSQGDTILTSGFSFYFPENLLLGTIEEYYQEKGKNFNRAKVKLTVDYDRLKNVYLIENFSKIEQDSLLKSMGND